MSKKSYLTKEKEFDENFFLIVISKQITFLLTIKSIALMKLNWLKLN